MNLNILKTTLGISVINLNWDTKEDGSINKEWASAFCPEKKLILSVPADVVKVLGSSSNLHLVARGEVLVKEVPYQRYIIAEHQEMDPERVIGSF